MSGFIDPDAPLRRRVDRLDAIIDVLLPTLDRSVLSPEAQQRLAEIDRKFGPPDQDELTEHRRRAEEQARAFFATLDPPEYDGPVYVGPEQDEPELVDAQPGEVIPS
jgi:hypothetical protein